MGNLLSMQSGLERTSGGNYGRWVASQYRLDASHDYEVNLKAEIEIMALHEKLDAASAADGRYYMLTAAVSASPWPRPAGPARSRPR